MDRVIDFNQLKNAAKDKDVDKFEQYIYNLYYSVAQGELSMGDFSREILKYMEENNISQEKFFNMQKKLMERYGLSTEVLEEQMKALNLNTKVESYETIRKSLGFQEKYKDRIGLKNISTYYIKNETNNLFIIIDGESLIIRSEGKIDLMDNELNEFLCSYKKVLEGNPIHITLCENVHNYEY